MIIAEIGVNHLGDKNYLLEYVNKLINSPVDAITLQIREQDFYKTERFSDFFLDLEVYPIVSKMISDSNKKFGIALSNLEYVSFFDEIVDFYKILSKDLGDYNFVDKLINVTDKPIFISTGLSSYDEIRSFIKKINISKEKNITLIHTRLSNKVEDTNLKAIEKMKSAFNCPIAFGNHCKNVNVTYAALAFNPSSIFLYTKGQKDVYHPDEEHAIPLNKISEFCKNLNQIKLAIGSGVKSRSKNTIRGQND